MFLPFLALTWWQSPIISAAWRGTAAALPVSNAVSFMLLPWCRARESGLMQIIVPDVVRASMSARSLPKQLSWHHGSNANGDVLQGIRLCQDNECR